MLAVPPSAVPLVVSSEEEAELRRLVRTPSTPQKIAQRARIVLLAAQGETNVDIADRVDASLPTVGLWRSKFADRGLVGLFDEPRPGRPRIIDDETVERIIARSLEPPPTGETHWSVRLLADALDLAPTTVHRIWRSHGIKPHQVRTFKYSTDPELEAKVIDVVGLYLNAPENALVLCVDEKTQIQALDRTQPTLPMKRGKAARWTHDYKRNGTTSLYAALHVATGEVVGECFPRHRRHQEFLAFLRLIVKTFRRGELHLILDNSSTHTTSEVEKWLDKHPRVHFHFTPKGASWLNLIESWFSILHRQHLRRGVHRNVQELIDAIKTYIDSYNQRAKPFVWTKPADEVLRKAKKPKAISGTEHQLGVPLLPLASDP